MVFVARLLLRARGISTPLWVLCKGLYMYSVTWRAGRASRNNCGAFVSRQSDTEEQMEHIHSHKWVQIKPHHIIIQLPWLFPWPRPWRGQGALVEDAGRHGRHGGRGDSTLTAGRATIALVDILIWELAHGRGPREYGEHSEKVRFHW